jgi:hypothetical protein
MACSALARVVDRRSLGCVGSLRTSGSRRLPPGVIFELRTLELLKEDRDALAVRDASDGLPEEPRH